MKNKIKQSWAGAFSGKQADEFIPVRRKKESFCLSKRFIGGVIYSIGFLLKISDIEHGETLMNFGGIVIGLGVGHAAVKSSPAHNGQAGWFFKLINRIFTK